MRALVLATRHITKVNPFERPSELEHAPLEPNVGRTSTVLLAKRTTHAVVIRTHFDPDEAAFTRNLKNSKDGKKLALASDHTGVALRDLFDDGPATPRARPFGPRLNHDANSRSAGRLIE